MLGRTMIAAMLALAMPAAAQEGWTVAREAGRAVLTPPGAPAVSLTVNAPEATGGDLMLWFAGEVAAVAGRTPGAEIGVEPRTDGRLLESVLRVPSEGRTIYLYVAADAPADAARLVTLSIPTGDAVALLRHGTVANRVALDPEAALASIGAPPPAPRVEASAPAAEPEAPARTSWLDGVRERADPDAPSAPAATDADAAEERWQALDAMSPDERRAAIRAMAQEAAAERRARMAAAAGPLPTGEARRRLGSGEPIPAGDHYHPGNPGTLPGWRFTSHHGAYDLQAPAGLPWLRVRMHAPQPIAGSSSARGWFFEWLKAQDAQLRIGKRNKIEAIEPFWLYAFRDYDTPEGAYRQVRHYAVQDSADTVRVMSIHSRAKEDHYAHEEDALKALRRLMLEEADDAWMKPKVAAYKGEVDAEREREAEKERRKALLGKRRTAPGRGIGEARVEAAFHDLKMVDNLGSVKGVDVVLVLLKDGSGYRDQGIPPSDLDEAVSRQVDPWLEWRRAGGGYEYRYLDGGNWRKVPGIRQPKRYLPETLDFEGSWIEAWGDLMMGGGVSEGWIVLTKAGEFRTSSSSMFASGALASNLGLAPAAGGSGKGPDGEWSTTIASGFPALMNRTKRPMTGGGDRTGVYRIDGYTIDFLADSGKRTRRSIYADDRKSIVIGTRAYNAR